MNHLVQAVKDKYGIGNVYNHSEDTDQSTWGDKVNLVINDVAGKRLIDVTFTDKGVLSAHAIASRERTENERRASEARGTDERFIDWPVSTGEDEIDWPTVFIGLNELTLIDESPNNMNGWVWSWKNG